MHNLQNRLTSCRGTFRGREDSNGLLGGPRILLTMDINSDGRHRGRKQDSQCILTTRSLQSPVTSPRTSGGTRRFTLLIGNL